MRCTARRAFIVTPVSFCKKMSLPASKARAEPRHGTGAPKERLSALHEPTAECTRPSAIAKASAVRQEQTLQRKQLRALHNADADKLVEGRGDARIVLAVRVRCQK